jgi:hypothetical protein
MSITMVRDLLHRKCKTCLSSHLSSFYCYPSPSALRRSTECFNARHQIQHNLTFLIAKGRQELSKAQTEYASTLALARQQYMAEKRAHDAKRLPTLLTSMRGRAPVGTPLTAQCITQNVSLDGRPHPFIHEVAGCIADVIDGAITIAEGKSTIPAFREFVPPSPPGFNSVTGEDMAEKQRRVEGEYRVQYNLMNQQFQTSESERAKAWRKMMKTKAELDMPHEHVLHGVRQVIRVTQSNYTQIPMPAFQGSVNVALPRELSRQGFSVASYRPPTSTGTGTGTSTSKYSADNVRQRKSADGTVAPVSEPKKTKEGLYMRPAGRTRKGMRWDAFNGVWVPQNES